MHTIWQSAKVIVRVAPSWQEICELITETLNTDAIANVPFVSKLYDEHDTEITSKDQLEDGKDYFTHRQAVLAKKRGSQGMNRTLAKARAYETQQEWTNPLESPLISPQSYQRISTGFIIHPKKLIVRANRWYVHFEPVSCDECYAGLSKWRLRVTLCKKYW